MIGADLAMPPTTTLPIVNVVVDVVRQKRIERFHRSITPGDKALHDLVDYFEGQIGTVLSVHDEHGKTLFRAAFEAWEAGVQ